MASDSLTEFGTRVVHDQDQQTKTAECMTGRQDACWANNLRGRSNRRKSEERGEKGIRPTSAALKSSLPNLDSKGPQLGRPHSLI